MNMNGIRQFISKGFEDTMMASKEIEANFRDNSKRIEETRKQMDNWSKNTRLIKRK